MAIVNERPPAIETQTPSSSREGVEMRAKTRDCRNVIRRLETCWLIADEFSFRLDHQQGKKMEKSGRKQNMRFCFHSIPLGFNLPPSGTGTATAHCTLYLVDNDHPANQPAKCTSLIMNTIAITEFSSCASRDIPHEKCIKRVIISLAIPISAD